MKILETGPGVTMMVNWNIDELQLCALEELKRGRPTLNVGGTIPWARVLDPIHKTEEND